MPFAQEPKCGYEEVAVDGAKEQIVLASYDVISVPRTAIAQAKIWLHRRIRDLLPFGFRRFPPL